MLVEKAQEHLQFLCETLATRRVGSQGNQQAAAYFKETMHALGHALCSQKFACIDFETSSSNPASRSSRINRRSWVWFPPALMGLRFYPCTRSAFPQISCRL